MSLLCAGLNVGGAVRRFDLPPIRVCQSHLNQLTHRYRGQAPSHILSAFSQEDVL